jgi:3,4-dihydroxy 2-butanone 4-phosphate synthase / GTP cyclohydrolase II
VALDYPIISSTEDIIADFREGKMVILVDEEDRENEGDLVIAAEFVTPAAINFMARYGRGLICLTLTAELCRRLNLPLMVTDNRSPYRTNFTLSIEAASGVTTGISAADRAHTVKVAIAPKAKPQDIIQPGHIFPLMANDNGVLVRAGHTEAGCDLARLAGLTPASVICEILKDNGEMARLPDLMEFSQQHGLKIGTIADLIHYRSQTEKLIERAAERTIQTMFGTFKIIAYTDKSTGDIHLALVRGEIVPEEETIVRVHEPLSVMDFFITDRAAHSWSVSEAMRYISRAKCGVIVLLRKPESTEDLLHRIIAPKYTSKILPTMDLRDYGIGAQILKDLKVGKMRILGVPRKMPSMAGFDLEVTGYVGKLPNVDKPPD